MQRLTKKYRILTAVDHLELTIRQGEFFCLLGANGAGKTTAVKMLSCLTKPSGGDTFFAWEKHRAEKRCREATDR